MTNRLKLICAFLLSLSMLSAHAQDDNVMRFGLYVRVSDLDKSSAFYEKVFQKKPYVRNDKLAGFDVAGGLYAVFAESVDAGTLVRGNNVVPYIRVKNVETEFERVKSLGVRLIDPKIVHEGPLKLFRFADPDGNVIEFFSVAADPRG